MGNVPKWRGRPPESGRPRGEGKLPGEGVAPGVGRLPVEEGVVVRGRDGQVDRGAPGQMDPWAENPWLPDGASDAAWKPETPDPGDDFYMHHPNFMGDKPG